MSTTSSNRFFLNDSISFFNKDNKRNQEKNSRKNKEDNNDDNEDNEGNENPTLIALLKIFGGVSLCMFVYKYYIYFKKHFTKKITFKELFRLLENQHLTKLDVS
jgi:hypothetical protein